ncbi:hypothetical protein L249_1565, partial [Ophiocordyceps polyrhachis-furcata BCC 54312]
PLLLHPLHRPSQTAIIYLLLLLLLIRWSRPTPSRHEHRVPAFTPVPAKAIATCRTRARSFAPSRKQTGSGRRSHNTLLHPTSTGSLPPSTAFPAQPCNNNKTPVRRVPPLPSTLIPNATPTTICNSPPTAPGQRARSGSSGRPSNTPSAIRARTFAPRSSAPLTSGCRCRLRAYRSSPRLLACYTNRRCSSTMFRTRPSYAVAFPSLIASSVLLRRSMLLITSASSPYASYSSLIARAPSPSLPTSSSTFSAARVWIYSGVIPLHVPPRTTTWRWSPIRRVAYFA